MLCWLRIVCAGSEDSDMSLINVRSQYSDLVHGSSVQGICHCKKEAAERADYLGKSCVERVCVVYTCHKIKMLYI